MTSEIEGEKSIDSWKRERKGKGKLLKKEGKEETTKAIQRKQDK